MASLWGSLVGTSFSTTTRSALNEWTDITCHFFWPGMKADVECFCNTRHTVVPPAALHLIPVIGEPFEHILVDYVGPLPKTKTGNQYMLTIMCVSTRLWKITASAITKAQTKFFTIFGLLKLIKEPTFCPAPLRKPCSLLASLTWCLVHIIQNLKVHLSIGTRL